MTWATEEFTPRSRWQTYAGPVLLAVLAVAVFGRVVGHEFLEWDDKAYIVHNSALERVSFASIGRLLTPGAMARERLYIPLTYLSLLGGQSAAAVHAVNLLLHVANALLVYAFIRRLGHGRLRAWLVGAVFAMHPLQVESVAWALGRKEVLSGLLALASLLAYVGWREHRRWRWYGAVLALFVLSLLAKPTTVILPGLLILLDYRDGTPVTRRDWLLKVPFAAFSLAAWQLTAALATASPLPWRGQLLFAAYLPRVFNGWLQRLFLLEGTPVVYLTRSLDPASIRVMSYLPLLLLAAGVYVAWRLRARSIWFGAGFAVLAWLPGVSVLLAHSRYFYTADRYSYLALPGVAYAVTAGLERWRRGKGAGARLRQAHALACIAFVLTAGIMAFRLVPSWRTTQTLTAYMLAQNPDNYLAMSLCGTAELRQGNHAEAMAWYRRALAHKPDHETAWHNLQIAANAHGRTAEELARYRRMERLCRYGAPAHVAYLRGRAHKTAGRTAAARAAYEAAVRACAQHAEAHFRLGNLHADAGRVEAARQAYAEAVRHRPQFGAAWFNLGHLHLQHGRPQRAVTCLQRARRLLPDDVDAAVFLARAHLQSDNIKAALTVLDDALAEYPQNHGVLETLVHAYALASDLDTARHYRSRLQAQGADVTPALRRELERDQ